MTITQLLTDLALIAGVLLFAVLAIVPLWLEHEAERADRAYRAAPAATPRRSLTRVPDPRTTQAASPAHDRVPVSSALHTSASSAVRVA